MENTTNPITAFYNRLEQGEHSNPSLLDPSNTLNIVLFLPHNLSKGLNIVPFRAFVQRAFLGSFPRSSTLTLGGGKGSVTTDQKAHGQMFHG